MSGERFEVAVDTPPQLITSLAAASNSGGGCIRLVVSANYTGSGQDVMYIMKRSVPRIFCFIVYCRVCPITAKPRAQWHILENNINDLKCRHLLL